MKLCGSADNAAEVSLVPVCFHFDLLVWRMPLFSGRRFALRNLLLLSVTLELNISSLWGVFCLFCVTTGSRGAIYKCHPSNTFCTHVATCHPTPTSLLHCGNSPVTGIFLAKFRWNTADPIWASQMICVITLPVLQQTVIWTFNVTQSCLFTETDSHWWPLCQIRGRRLSVFFFFLFFFPELNCARSALSVLTSSGR